MATYVLADNCLQMHPFYLMEGDVKAILDDPANTVFGFDLEELVFYPSPLMREGGIRGPTIKAGDRVIILTDFVSGAIEKGTVGSYLDGLPEGVRVAFYWPWVKWGYMDGPSSWKTERAEAEGTLRDGRRYLVGEYLNSATDLAMWNQHCDGDLPVWFHKTEYEDSFTTPRSTYSAEEIEEWEKELGRPVEDSDFVETYTRTRWDRIHFIFPIGSKPASSSTRRRWRDPRVFLSPEERADAGEGRTAKRWRRYLERKHIRDGEAAFRKEHGLPENPRFKSWVDDARGRLQGMRYMEEYQPSKEAEDMVHHLCAIPSHTYTVQDIIDAAEAFDAQVNSMIPEGEDKAKSITHPQSVAQALCMGLFRRVPGTSDRFSWRYPQHRVAVWAMAWGCPNNYVRQWAIDSGQFVVDVEGTTYPWNGTDEIVVNWDERLRERRQELEAEFEATFDPADYPYPEDLDSISF